MKFKVLYRRARFTVIGSKPKRCALCGRKGRLELHHWRYAYKTSQVRKAKQLALENTTWLCFRCHMKADALRIMDEMSPTEWASLDQLRYFALHGIVLQTDDDMESQERDQEHEDMMDE